MSETEKPKEKMDTGSGKKRVRQRKLGLYDNIRKQMEFYFSTPNLQKDRFLKKLVMSDPEGFVDLEMFLNFNKIKALTTDLACIAKAVKESKTLTVDETGKKIKRKCKFEEPQDTDQRTVYAEFLPKDATIDWLIKHFSQVGKVVHVSLPKYKSTGDIKGFAFVEFETTEAAAKACQLLNCPSEKVSCSKPGIFAKTFKTGRHMKKALQQDSDAPEAMELDGNAPEVKEECEDRIKEEKMEVEGTTSSQEVQVSKDKSKKKRKRSESFSGQKETKTLEDVKPGMIDEDIKPDMTNDDDKLDTSKDDVQPADDVVERKKSKKKRKRSESCDAVRRVKVEKLEEPEDVQESTTKKKKPKPVKVEEEDGDAEKNDAEKPETAVKPEPDRSGTENAPKKKPAKKKAKQGVEQRKEGLRVISKQEWLEYRQDYYQRHKQNMSELKLKIREVKRKQTTLQATDDQPGTIASNGDLSEAASTQPIKKEEGLTFVPGVIIKVTLAEPVTKKFLKEHMSGSGKVAFLDMIEGDSTAHARCEDVDSAATILKTSTDECQYTLLQGEEEKSYWDKVFSDREKRLSTKTKKKVRGNDKILAKADKVLRSMKEKTVHIVFDD